MVIEFESSVHLTLPRYQKTGTPLNKELREYVEQMSKSKTKVEPEEVVVPSTGDPPAKPEVDSCRHTDSSLGTCLLSRGGTLVRDLTGGSR